MTEAEQGVSKEVAKADEDDETSTWRTPRVGEHSDLYVRFLRAVYMPFLVRYCRLVLVAWFIVFIVCLIYGPAFLNLTKSNLDLPAGTPSAEAIDAFTKNYPQYGSWAPAIVIQHSEVPGTSVIQQAQAQAVHNSLMNFVTKYPKVVEGVSDYWSFMAMTPPLDVLAKRELSADQATSISTVLFRKSTTLTDIYEVCDDLLKWSKGFSTPELSVYATGLFPLFDEMQKQTAEDFSTIDETVLPICIAILGIYLMSYRHMGISLINLGCTILLTFGVLVPITSQVDINPFSPSILLSLGIAVCFDYSLFMLTRFKEERLFQQVSREDAVFNMLQNSGHVVLLSGSTLFTTFILLLIFPQNFLQSVGYCCSVVVMAAMIVNMSVTPAMLLCCSCFSHFDPICFSKPYRSLCCLVPKGLSPWEAAEQREDDLRARAGIPSNYFSRLAFFLFGGVNAKDGSFIPVAKEQALTAPAGGADEAGKQQRLPNDEALGESKHNTPDFQSITASAAMAVPVAMDLSAGSQQQQQQPPKARNLWFRFSYFCTKRPWLVMTIMCGCTIPFLITFLNFTPTSDDYLIYLQTSRSLAGLKVMKSAFSEGRLDQYKVIISTGKAGSLLTQDYFSTESVVVNHLLQSETKFIDAAGISGLSYFNSQPVSLTTALSYLAQTSGTYTDQSVTAQSYRLLVASMMNADMSTSMVNLELIVPPNSQVAVPFIKNMRSKLQLLQSSPPAASLPTKMYLFGGYTTTLDVQDSLYALVPVMIGITVAIVLISVGVSFGSVLLALRLAFTIFVSLCWTYGLMVLVYQPGQAQNDFAKLTPTIEASSGIYWIIPIMGFSILVGLALDYDIFLVSRLVEFRRLGWSDRAAICLAIEKTAGVITTAGLIMSISFAGLLIPKTIVLNQYGFSLFIGVAMDTFVIRTTVVPAIITLFGSSVGEAQLNWWPSVMPPLAYATEEEEEAALMAGLWVPAPGKKIGGGGGGDDESAGLVRRKQLEYEDEGEVEAVVLAGGGKASVQGV